MTDPQSSGLWLHLPQGRYRLADDADVEHVIAVLRGPHGDSVDITDETGAPGVAVLRPGGDPVVVLGAAGSTLRGRPAPGVGPNSH